ncbi:MAG TPA: hypothetical protein VGE12_08555 [Noviherbaspirillum sp.]
MEFLTTTIACVHRKKPAKRSETKRKEIIPEPFGKCMLILPLRCESLAGIVNDGAQANRYIFHRIPFSAEPVRTAEPFTEGSTGPHANAAGAANSPCLRRALPAIFSNPAPGAATAEVCFVHTERRRNTKSHSHKRNAWITKQK